MSNLFLIDGFISHLNEYLVIKLNILMKENKHDKMFIICI